MSGSLVVAGTGISLGAHMTGETEHHIRNAEAVCFIASDPLMARWVRELNPAAISLHSFFAEGKPRHDSYTEIVKYVLGLLANGRNVCAVFYGHPGVFVYPSHELISRARKAGHDARMLPGISAEDCLFADLGIDPGQPGCQSFEATYFLLCGFRPNTCCSLILWQIGFIGRQAHIAYDQSSSRLDLLTDALLEHYTGSQKVAVYEAAHYPFCSPHIVRLPLRDLPAADVTPFSTLYIPPAGKPELNDELVKSLGIDPARLHISRTYL